MSLALASVFKPYDCSIKCGALASLYLKQLSQYAPNFGVEVRAESNPSGVTRDHVVARAVSPKIGLTSTDLSILSSIGMAGLNIVPASAKPGFVAFGRNVPDGALPDAVTTTSHVKCQVSDGLLIPLKLSAKHNQPASLDLVLLARQGTVATYSLADVMHFSTGQALDDSSIAVPHEWTLGPLSYTPSGGSATILSIEEATVNFGIEARPEGDNGNAFPLRIPIMGQQPTYEFMTHDLAFANVVGAALECTAFVQYFRKMKAGATPRELNATGAHVSLTETIGTIVPGAVSLRGGMAPGTGAFTFYSKSTTAISVTDTIPAGA